MKRFKFKLETVQKYRQVMEGLAKNTYQEALRQLNHEKEKLTELDETRTQVLGLYNVESGNIVHQESLAFLANYTMQLNYLMEIQGRVIEEKELVAAERFDEWNDRRKDYEVIKKLREKQWKKYLREVDKEEQKFQDEIFIAKKIRERI